MATLPTNRATASTPQEHLDDHGVLAGAYNTDSVFLSAADLQGVNASIATFQGWFQWIPLSATADSSGVGAFVMPSHWTSFNVETYWANTAASTGNVVWRLVFSTNSEDGVISAVGTPQVTFAAGAQYALKKSTLAQPIGATAGQLNSVAVERRGGDAADTLANTMGLLGLRIFKVT